MGIVSCDRAWRWVGIALALGAGACGFHSTGVQPPGGDAATTDSDADTDTDSDPDTGSDSETGVYDAGPIDVAPTTLSAGAEHSCAVTAEGEVACWGGNRAGQSGGEGWVRYPAGVVGGFGSDIAAVSAGGGHTCALTTDGAVLCMGMNWAGQLGTDQACPDPGDENCVFGSPVAAIGLESGVASVHAGGQHTCAVLETGEVYCFGANEFGQSGQECVGDECAAAPLPSPVTGLDAPAVDVAAGATHSCALLENGEVMCWGWQEDGRLGNPWAPDGPTPTPVEVPDLWPGSIALAVGDEHSCAVRSDGAVLCWGRCDYGGNCGTNLDSWFADSPVIVDGIPGAPIDIAAGHGFTCVLNAAGEVHCFGSLGASSTPESVGQSYDQIVLPHRIAGLPDDIVRVTAGYAHACALSAGGQSYCWGQISRGQLGVMPVGEAFAVPGLETGVARLALGGRQVCGLLADGIVRCFAFPWDAVPSIADYDVGATQIAAGELHACALDAAGDLWCWGDNAWSQLGAESAYFSEDPIPVAGLPSGLTDLTARGDATTVLTDDGRVYLVGDYERVISIGEETVIRDPAPPLELEAIGPLATDVLDGNCAVQASGELTCVARGETAPTMSLPFGVSAYDRSLAQGGDHACFLTLSGALLCAGQNDHGQLGNGDTWDGFEGPFAVDGFGFPVLGVAAGIDHSCAVSETTGVQCWGWNYSGQVGDGTMLESHVPVPVVGITGEVAAVAAAAGTSCALTADGAVYCWGERAFASYDDVADEYLTAALPVVGLSALVP
jgi:alpha-tubulin suppressor-like RCC1 family protein